ncbi:2-hydroxyacid dehydrogenase [Terrihabitans sp. B22-R8]|uniref:2-hydroxyacid dehydrogenase n=1 Tax=Terrihabitans sp. B22-R8 TaxID=3425128 RepID=UPI00403D152B
MRTIVFSTQPYDQHFLDEALHNHRGEGPFELVYEPASLSLRTAALAQGSHAVCAFVNDVLDAPVLEALHGHGVRAILMRCAGFNNVDIAAARRLGLFVARVPAYSPEAVAEHALALVMTLNRHTHRAYNRVREGNFMLNGLLGFNLHGKTAGIVGTGKIGLALARILHGFGCTVLGHDPFPSEAFAPYGTLTGLDDLLRRSDIISLHCPLTDGTRHMIDAASLARMKRGAMLINTSRGGLIDTGAVIAALKSHQLGYLGIDVYEQENALFFHDRSSDIIDDDLFQRLMTFPNVLVTGHQGFLTREALEEIARVTFHNMRCFRDGVACENRIG